MQMEIIKNWNMRNYEGVKLTRKSIQNILRRRTLTTFLFSWKTLHCRGVAYILVLTVGFKQVYNLMTTSTTKFGKSHTTNKVDKCCSHMCDTKEMPLPVLALKVLVIVSDNIFCRKHSLERNKISGWENSLKYFSWNPIELPKQKIETNYNIGQHRSSGW